jgi:hypothetical protein
MRLDQDSEILTLYNHKLQVNSNTYNRSLSTASSSSIRAISISRSASEDDDGQESIATTPDTSNVEDYERFQNIPSLAVAQQGISHADTTFSESDPESDPESDSEYSKCTNPAYLKLRGGASSDDGRQSNCGRCLCLKKRRFKLFFCWPVHFGGNNQQNDMELQIQSTQSRGTTERNDSDNTMTEAEQQNNGKQKANETGRNDSYQTANTESTKRNSNKTGSKETVVDDFDHQAELKRIMDQHNHCIQDWRRKVEQRRDASSKPGIVPILKESGPVEPFISKDVVRNTKLNTGTKPGKKTDKEENEVENLELGSDLSMLPDSLLENEDEMINDEDGVRVNDQESGSDHSIPPESVLARKVKEIDVNPIGFKKDKPLGAVNNTLPSMLDVDNLNPAPPPESELPVNPKHRYTPSYLPERYNRLHSWPGPEVRCYAQHGENAWDITNTEGVVVDERGKAVQPDVIAIQSRNMENSFRPGGAAQ